ncbi:hypothetical protein [Staphylococcus americanisciuri]|uniref:Phage protein n=1 Tax=Staphylococcus americanisciuri TaxID=2973940 RepID=A0ABT2F3W7_9STAP|nr:hypothetical protein [Staphylococcus americanisciuri]MCS4487174.1 hypothetical protein [Staphylococcus americanisciuri]
MKKQLFKHAWKLAKEGAEKFGGTSKEYFAEALKMAWAILKDYNRPEIEVPAWIVRKNVGNVHVVAKSVLSVEKETEKALCIHATGKFGSFSFWTPKSVLKEKNVTDYFNCDVTVECELETYMNTHFDLVKKAKELGIKGVHARMKSSTLRRKIKEATQVA